MKLRTIIFTEVLLALQFSSCLWARPITSDEAEMVVTGWLKTDSQPMGMIFNEQVNRIDTFMNDNSKPIYYIVYLEPTGFVIVSADDLIEPIIGFVNGDIYDPSPNNPLGALVTSDLKSRIRDTTSRFLLTVCIKRFILEKEFNGFGARRLLHFFHRNL